MIKLTEKGIGSRTWELGNKYKIEVCCYKHPCNKYSIWYIKGMEIYGERREEKYVIRALFEMAKR